MEISSKSVEDLVLGMGAAEGCEPQGVQDNQCTGYAYLLQPLTEIHKRAIYVTQR